MKARAQPSLLQRALTVFVVLAIFLAAFLWAGRTLVQRHVERVQLDTHRMAALKTFESAIVALRSLPDHAEISADEVRREFAWCAGPLLEQPRRKAPEHPGNTCAGGGQAEELACYLRNVDARLADMGGNDRSDRERMLGQTYAVSVARWAHAVRMTQGLPTPGSPTEGVAAALRAVPAGPSRERVSCHDALGAARQLAANQGRLLMQLSWRDLTAKKTVASLFGPEQAVMIADRTLEQRNPWGGIPGCIYFGGDGGELVYLSDKRATNRAACTAMRPAGADVKSLVGAREMGASEKPGALDPAWTVPPSLPVMLADLDNVRLPGKQLYRAYTEQPAAVAIHASLRGEGVAIAQPHGPNELERQNHKVEVGFNVHLTISPEAQRAVQQVSQCYAGDQDACKLAGLAGDKKYTDFTRQMYESAAVRMAAVAVIDIASGKIEALGSAHSDCYRQEYDGPGRNRGQCPDLPTTPHYEPDRLLNHALYTDALPASTIKPIMAMGFMHDVEYRKKIIADRVGDGFARMQDELKSSDSAAFLDRMFCRDKGFADCHRPHDVQNAALLMGWDAGCADASFRCGRLDVLFGVAGAGRIRPDAARMPLGATAIYGRLLTESAAAHPADFSMMQNFSFDARLAAGCSRGDEYSGTAKNHAWRKCKEGHFSRIEHEGWGQGNARSTAIGAAGMLARLAAAANGQRSLRLPHLVEKISDSRAQAFDLAVGQFHLADPVKLDIPQADAAFILAGMISHKSAGAPRGTRSGTANAACVRVFDTQACNGIDWIAGKTGTPPYGNDEMTLAAIKRKCGRSADRGRGDPEPERDAACGSERPYKWYVAVFQSDPGAPGFNKAIAVLTERNWYKSGPLAGKVHSPGDHDDLNVSAEMAFRIMNRLRGGAPADTRPRPAASALNQRADNEVPG